MTFLIRETHLPVPPVRADSAGEVDPALAVPVCHQRGQPGHVLGGERAGGAARRQSGVPQQPGTDGFRLRRERVHTYSTIATTSFCNKIVQHLGIGAQLGSGPGQRVRYSRPERGLERGQRVEASTDARETAVGIVRVLPGTQVAGRRGGHRAPDVQQRTAEDPAHRRHAGQRARAGAAGQAEQHRFRLVVECVAEQHRGRSGLRRRSGQRRVPRVPCCRLETALAGHLDPDGEHRVQPEVTQLSRHLAGMLGGPVPQTVIDGYPARSQARARCHERQRGGQRQRVGTAGASGEHERARLEIAQTATDRVPHRGDRRIQARQGPNPPGPARRKGR